MPACIKSLLHTSMGEQTNASLLHGVLHTSYGLPFQKRWRLGDFTELRDTHIIYTPSASVLQSTKGRTHDAKYTTKHRRQAATA